MSLPNFRELPGRSTQSTLFAKDFYYYYVNKRTPTKLYLICHKTKECSARASITGATLRHSNSTDRRFGHSHAPEFNYEPVQLLVEKIKSRVRRENGSLRNIFNEECRRKQAAKKKAMESDEIAESTDEAEDEADGEESSS